MAKLNWRTTPLTIEQWKEDCRNSWHVRKNDVVVFSESDNRGVVNCFIEGTSVMLGSYFTTKQFEMEANRGWNHE